MPRSKTGAGPGLNGAFFTSKKTPKAGAKFSYKNRLDRGRTRTAWGIFLS